jgi:uncharacterized OsmC-like protein
MAARIARRSRTSTAPGGKDDSRQKPFVFSNGEPPVLLGANEGANPVEFLLHALAGCVTTTFVLHAAARGIRIEELSTELEGDLDVQGLLGLDESVSPGYEQIRIKMHVKADGPDEEYAISRERLRAVVERNHAARRWMLATINRRYAERHASET